MSSRAPISQWGKASWVGKSVGNVEHSPGFPPLPELWVVILILWRKAGKGSSCAGGAQREGCQDLAALLVMSVKRGIQIPALQGISQGTPEFGTFLPQSLTVLVFLWCVDLWSQPTPQPSSQPLITGPTSSL